MPWIVSELFRQGLWMLPVVAKEGADNVAASLCFSHHTVMAVDPLEEEAA